MRFAAGVLLTAAVLTGQHPGLRSFLVSPDVAAEAWLNSAEHATAPRSLEAARDQRDLAPGYHVLRLPGVAPAVVYVAVVPAGAAPANGRPLLGAPAPRPATPPDELPVRAAYGGFLESGFTVLVPVRPGAMGLKNAPVTPERDAWSLRGGDVMAGLLADLCLRTPVDREQLVVMGRLPTFPSTLNQATWPKVEVTPFAACWVPLAGGAGAPSPPDPLRWAGRGVILHGCGMAPDKTALVAGALRSLKPPASVRVLTDPRLRWIDRVQLHRRSIEPEMPTLRRPGEPRTISFRAGGDHPGRHEWLSVAETTGREIRARRQGAEGVIETPAAPAATVRALTVWFAGDPGPVRVSVNGRPVFGGTIPHDARTALRCLRREARTGRPTSRVLTVRP